MKSQTALKITCARCNGTLDRIGEGNERRYQCRRCHLTTYLLNGPTASVPATLDTFPVLDATLLALPAQFEVFPLLSHLWEHSPRAWTLTRLLLALQVRGYTVRTVGGSLWASTVTAQEAT